MATPAEAQNDQLPETKADEEDDTTSSALHGLIARAHNLLAELQHFRERLDSLRQTRNVELGHFRGNIQSELSMLERLVAKPLSTSTQHVARSSNLPFLECVWSTVKKSKGVIALQKRIYTNSSVKLLSQGMKHVDLNLNGSGTKAKGQKPGKGQKENAVVVDAITNGGRTWTKVSLVTNQRMLFDLAKQGWDSGGSDSEDDDFSRGQDEEDDDRDIPVLKTAKELTFAANCFRVKTKNPKVHLILPRVTEGEVPEIDRILEDCRKAGAELFCGGDLEPERDIKDAVKTMAVDPQESFSDVLNIDCTILLALVSEFSHAKVEKAPWFHRALQRQVEIEDNENLLPSLLYPAMGNKQLVCTHEAVKRMREIVETIGTPSEKARTNILLGGDKTKNQADLIEEMQEWSAYSVPKDWQLPIQVVDPNENECQQNLPAQALETAKDMTDINYSVFLYGWATGRTTITSNRTVVKQIETHLETYVDLPDESWPGIWLCPTARSLVGKEKRGAPKKSEPLDEVNGKKEPHTAWPLPDPLRRELQRRNGLDVLSQRAGYEVEDLRPNGYPMEEVIEAKENSIR
ncbi:hypothetical protein KC330_g7490 [Hortaea werneckii]|nr:hypothetical protein KC330_g7490 [Hortaea werneckii]